MSPRASGPSPEPIYPLAEADRPTQSSDATSRCIVSEARSIVTSRRPAPADPPTRRHRGARGAFVVNALVAWVGVVVTLVISAAGGYASTTPDPGLYGLHPDGAAGVLSRVSDTLSYFTIWSNVVVAVSVTLAARRSRGGLAERVLRLDAVLMITVTAIVYQVLLAPTAVVVGWSRLTDPILHVVTPVVTVTVWLAFGPRGWVTSRVVPLALLVPLAWIVWLLGRGALVGAYPYDVANVTARGVGPVAVTLVLILVFGLAVACVSWGLEVLLRRRRATVGPGSTAAEG